MHTKDYMRVARAIARLSDLDPQVGAILVDKFGMVTATGFNWGIGEIVHAEMECLDHAKREPTMYVTTQPCMACAKRIVASSIRELYYQNPWWDEATLTALANGGIVVKRIRRTNGRPADSSQ